MKNKIFPAYLAGFYIIWLYLLFTTTGLEVYVTHWLYSVMMIFGATIAGFTPMGGGAISYPVLSLYFDIDATVARDFSLAIQSIGMTSAAIYIITRKSHSKSFYAQLPSYIIVSIISFLLTRYFYDVIPVSIIKMTFVTFALTFMASYTIDHHKSIEEIVQPKWKHRILYCGLGGVAAALFGTGTDMLLYIMLNGLYDQEEESATDLSIIVMAAVSITATLIHPPTGEVYNMWIAAAPVVILFAPFGNMLLTITKKYYMLFIVLAMNSFNYIYWVHHNLNLLFPSIILTITFYLLFRHYGQKSYSV